MSEEIDPRSTHPREGFPPQEQSQPGLTGKTVSYTHLTLPTIYSV